MYPKRDFPWALALIFGLVAMILAMANECKGQTVKKSVDDFTGNKIEKTSYEVLIQNLKMNAFISAWNVDGNYLLKLKLMLGAGTVHAIDGNAIFFIKLKDDTIIELRNTDYQLSCTGCGARNFFGSTAQGTETTYFLSTDQLNKLRNTEVSKIRIYTTQGYVEGDINQMRASAIKDILALLSY